jgi:tetratricopeptide (TPR) repeat protein
MPRLKFKLNWSLTLLVLSLGAQMNQNSDASSSARAWTTAPVIIDSGPPEHRPPTATVSAEVLRYPLSDKALQMLRKALQISDAGDHARAIRQLQKTLDKCPGTDAYVYSLIGVEYIKSEQIPQAVDALEQAVKLLPRDASNHANLGLALFSEAQYDRAEWELKRALELDPHYKMATQVLSVLAARNTHQ